MSGNSVDDSLNTCIGRLFTVHYPLNPEVFKGKKPHNMDCRSPGICSP